MAKQKVRNETFAEMRKRLMESSVTQAKTVAVFHERKYFLIVCEGAKTEPAYFEYIQNMLPKNLLTTIDIRGEGDNTINIVRKAIALREERAESGAPAYDEVWAVYDKDDFPASRYNQAVTLSEKNGVKSGHSNQSFELWYVLHFMNLQTALHRNAHIKILSENILKARYEKNDPNIAALMFTRGNVKQAIKWAKALDENCTKTQLTPAESCPHTRVHILVEELLKYCNPAQITKK
jgi:hypothetical protein